MKTRNWFLWLLAILFLVVFLWKPQIGWQARGILVKGFSDSSQGLGSQNLVLENEKLRAELAVLEGVKSQLPSRKENYIAAIIYANYPFNVKSEVLINAGEGEGVEKGRAVLIKDGILFGRVEKVFKKTSLVKTIFDARWRSSARIGKNGVEGLLVGGAKPKLTLIPKDAAINLGDIIYSADSEFPYGLALGEVLSVNLSRDNLFQEVEVGFGYDLSRIKGVLIDND